MNSRERELSEPLAKLVASDRTTAMHRYIRFCRQWCAFGSTFFNVKQIAKPYNVILGVHFSGLFVLVPGERKPLFSYRYSELLTWTPSISAFQVKVGGMTSSFELKYFTPNGEQILSVFQSYVDMLISRTQAIKQQMMVERAKDRQMELIDDEY